ncbi:MAG: hypothetical protein R3C39_01910 [Dehalococcoidia bacterium]
MSVLRADDSRGRGVEVEMQLLLFLIPVLMYFGWRARLAFRGERYVPRGHQTSRLDAMHEYMESHNVHRSARRRWLTAVFMLVGLGGITYFEWRVGIFDAGVALAMYALWVAVSIWLALWDRNR